VNVIASASAEPEAPDALASSAMLLGSRADRYQRLAVEDGAVALRELFKTEDEAVQRQLFAPVLAAWADQEPLKALAWLYDEAQDSLAARGYTVEPDFYDRSFRALAQQSPESAVASLAAVAAAPHRLRAVGAIIQVAQEKGMSLAVTMRSLTEHSASLCPVELALISKLLGDEVGYADWYQRITATWEQKLLVSELERLGLMAAVAQAPAISTLKQ
jgi:hypothetical protein